MSYETRSLHVYFLFEKPLKDFQPILLTLWLRYLQTHIKSSCIYLPNQFFFKTPNKTLKFQQNCCCCWQKNISKHDRMEVFLTDIHRKNHVYQQCKAMLLPSDRLLEMHFPAIWRPEFQKVLLCCPPWWCLMETVIVWILFTGRGNKF